MNILGIIPARGGSKGLPGKNLRMCAGKPLIQWTIESVSDLLPFVVSTDSPEIASFSKTLGAPVPDLRPKEFSNDTATLQQVTEHVLLSFPKVEAVLLLQPTSPLRTKEQIKEALELFKDKPVVSVCEPDHHPYFCKLINKRGELEELIPGSSKYHRRQDVPKVYSVNGAIFITPVSILKTTGLFDPPGSVPYIMDKISSIDINTEDDLLLAERYLK